MCVDMLQTTGVVLLCIVGYDLFVQDHGLVGDRSCNVVEAAAETSCRGNILSVNVSKLQEGGQYVDMKEHGVRHQAPTCSNIKASNSVLKSFSDQHCCP